MACLFCLILVAVLEDLKSYKIRNWLILTGVSLGFVFHIYDFSWVGTLMWFGGILSPIILLFPLFLFKVLGAGDIKLFSVIGSFYGSVFVIKSIVIAFIIGAIMSVIYLVKYKQVFYRLQHLVKYVQTVSQRNVKIESEDHKVLPYYDKERDGHQGVIHFSVAILVTILIRVIFGF